MIGLVLFYTRFHSKVRYFQGLVLNNFIHTHFFLGFSKPFQFTTLKVVDNFNKNLQHCELYLYLDTLALHFVQIFVHIQLQKIFILTPNDVQCLFFTIGVQRYYCYIS